MGKYISPSSQIMRRKQRSRSQKDLADDFFSSRGLNTAIKQEDVVIYPNGIFELRSKNLP